jgi:hypothetical protein
MKPDELTGATTSVRYPPFGADTGWIPIKMKATQIRLICMPR